MATTTLHPFESAGLGLAPFVCVGISEEWFKLADGTAKPAGSCDYCATAIAYKCHILSSDGKRFHVGCDCVRKLDRDDNRLLNQMERLRAQHDLAKKQVARQAKSESRRIALEARLQAQRDANGGKTDAEVAEAARHAEATKHASTMRKVNGWILEVLEQIGGSAFVDSMYDALHSRPAKTLSPRQLQVLATIYANHHGRYGSKAHTAALDAFDAKISQ
jgi:hypothetical protein